MYITSWILAMSCQKNSCFKDKLGLGPAPVLDHSLRLNISRMDGWMDVWVTVDVRFVIINIISIFFLAPSHFLYFYLMSWVLFSIWIRRSDIMVRCYTKVSGVKWNTKAQCKIVSASVFRSKIISRLCNNSGKQSLCLIKSACVDRARAARAARVWSKQHSVPLFSRRYLQTCESVQVGGKRR